MPGVTMRTNKVVSKMKEGRVAYGSRLSIPSTMVVELLGQAGLDFVMFDGEHGPFAPDMLDDFCRVADLAGVTPMSRVPNIEPSTILRYLDRGIMGIMGPHITTRERAQQLADACRYVPRGTRSFGDGRGSYYNDFASPTEYMEHANANILVIAQLEDIQVLDDIDGILSVEGIDLFASGAQDIAQSLGLPGQPNHPKVKEFEATVSDAVHAAGKKMLSDVALVARITEIILESLRDFIGSQESS